MCDKAILEKAGTLQYFPDCYKNQEMCNKAVEIYPHSFLLNAIRLKKYVIKLFILVLL